MTPETYTTLGSSAAAVIISITSLKAIQQMVTNFLLESKEQRTANASIIKEVTKHLSQISSRLEVNTKALEVNTKALEERNKVIVMLNEKADEQGNMLKEIYKRNVALSKEKVKN